MEDTSPLPKINKLPFIAVDVLLIVAALLIRFSLETPLSPFHVFLISGCIALGCVALCLPYLIEAQRNRHLMTPEQEAKCWQSAFYIMLLVNLMLVLYC